VWVHLVGGWRKGSALRLHTCLCKRVLVIIVNRFLRVRPLLCAGLDVIGVTGARSVLAQCSVVDDTICACGFNVCGVGGATPKIASLVWGLEQVASAAGLSAGVFAYFAILTLLGASVLVVGLRSFGGGGGGGCDGAVTSGVASGPVDGPEEGLEEDLAAVSALFRRTALGLGRRCLAVALLSAGSVHSEHARAVRTLRCSELCAPMQEPRQGSRAR